MTTESNAIPPKPGPMTRAKLARKYKINVPTLGRWIRRLKDPELKDSIRGKQQFTPDQHCRLLELLGDPDNDRD